MITDSHESLYNTIVFDSKDWCRYEKDAWLYGIVIGWDNTNSMFEEFNNRFKWTGETFNRLQLLHLDFINYKTR